MTSIHTIELASEPFHDTALLRFPALAAIPGFAHAVSTRPWNLSLHHGPDREQAVMRRRLICEHIGLPFDRLIAANQVHSPHVLRVTACDVGAGRDDHAMAVKFVDGLVCDLPSTPIIQFSADCPLLVAVDARRRVFGTAHASWRGTVAGIAGELLRQMRVECGVDPADLVVGVCPCAGPEEYEVGEEVRRIAAARLGASAEAFFPRRGGRIFFDMRAANVAQLTEGGVRPEGIFVATASTMSDSRFFSYRRDGAETGRFAVIAGFRE
jgi:YfiH family protein